MRIRFLVAAVASLAIAAAVSADETQVRIKGSDTIGGELAPAWARTFMEQHPGVNVTVEALGSGTAFTGLLDGSADIGASSRSVKPAELERARQLGVELREVVIGYDGIAVIVNHGNRVAQLTLADLAGIFSGKVQRWSEVGGDDRPIHLVSRPSYSGTHSFFKDKVLGFDGAPREFAATTEWVEENGQIVARIAADPDAVSYVGVGWANPTIKLVPVAARDGAAALLPGAATVRDGSYAIYRPLLLYTLGDPQGSAREFLQFVVSAPGQELVEKHGFVRAETSSLPAAAGGPTAAASEKSLAPVRIGFAAGATGLDAAARAALVDVAAKLKAGGFRAMISGHADSNGSADVNRTVALNRARTVARYLVREGVAVDLLVVTAEGSERPVATNTTLEGRQHNRRVDIQLVADR